MATKAPIDLGKSRATLLALLTHAKLTVNGPPPDEAPAEANLYPLLASVAALTSAHSTKLGLITKPPLEAPRAAAQVLQDISIDIVPALVSVFQIATASKYGAAVHDGIQQSVSSILNGFELVASGIEHGDSGKKNSQQPDRLAAIGMIWEASDRLARIATLRLVGLIAEKVNAHHDLLKDAVDEFREWLERAEDEDSGIDEQVAGHEADVDGDEEDEDDDAAFWNSDKAPPSAATKVIATPALKRIQLVSILYTAILKRRLKPSVTRLGCSPSAAESPQAELDVDVERLDRIGHMAKAIVSAADDTAAAFYEGDTDEAVTAQNKMLGTALELADACKMARGGAQTDEFSKWIEKFKENIEKDNKNP